MGKSEKAKKYRADSISTIDKKVLMVMVMEKMHLTKVVRLLDSKMNLRTEVVEKRVD